MRKRIVFAFLLCVMAFIATAFSVNAAASPVSLQLEVRAELTGDTPTSPEPFTFVLEAVDNAPMPETNRITIVGEGKSSFPSISYTELETYAYTLREIDGKAEGYTYDDTIYDVTVQITVDDAGNLQVSQYVSEQGSNLKKDKIVFVNQYKSEDKSTGNPTSGTDSVKTGDSTQLGFWLLVGVIALFGLFMVLILFRRNGRDQS